MCCGGTTSSSTSESQLPEWADQAAQDITSAAMDLAQTEYTPYEGQRVADFTGQQTAAFDLTDDTIGAWEADLDKSRSLWDQASKAYDGPSAAESAKSWGGASAVDTNKSWSGPSATSSLSSYGGPSNLSLVEDWGGASGLGTAGTWTDVSGDYMNDYKKGALDVAADELVRRHDIAQNDRNAEAVNAGAFGSARHGVIDAEADRSLDTALAQLYGQGLSDAYETGLSAYAAEKGLQLQGLGMDMSTGLTTQGQKLDASKADQAMFSDAEKRKLEALGLDMTQFNEDQKRALEALGIDMGQFNEDQARYLEGLGLDMDMFKSDRDAAAGAAKGYSDLGSLTSALNSIDISNLLSVGGLQQSQDQANLDVAYEDFLNQLYWPQEQLNWMTSVLSGQPYSTSTTTTSNDGGSTAANAASSLASSAIMAIAL